MAIQYIVPARNGGVESQGYLKGKARGMTILVGGNISADGPVTQAPNGTILGKGRSGTSVVPTPAQTPNRVVRALGVGVGDWATVRAGRYIFLGGNITSTIAGTQAYRGLAGGASDTGDRRSIHSRSASAAKKLLKLEWDWSTNPPTLTKTYRTTASEAPRYQTGDSTDHAVTTRAVPGTLCFLANGKQTTVANYTAKTGG